VSKSVENGAVRISAAYRAEFENESIKRDPVKRLKYYTAFFEGFSNEIKRSRMHPLTGGGNNRKETKSGHLLFLAYRIARESPW